METGISVSMMTETHPQRGHAFLFNSKQCFRRASGPEKLRSRRNCRVRTAASIGFSRPAGSIFYSGDTFPSRETSPFIFHDKRRPKPPLHPSSGAELGLSRVLPPLFLSMETFYPEFVGVDMANMRNAAG